LRITPGQVLGDWIEIPGDTVKPGDQVAVEKLHLLTNSQDVRAQ